MDRMEKEPLIQEGRRLPDVADVDGLVSFMGRLTEEQESFYLDLLLASLVRLHPFIKSDDVKRMMSVFEWAGTVMEMPESVRPIFTEVIVAPDYDADALELLQTKKKNLRILKVSEPPKSKTQFRQIDGGLLVQSTDLIDAPGDDPNAWKLVSGEPADEQTVKDLVFAWRAIRCVKSNAILIAHDQATVGIGMGQVNRVDSANLSVERANTLADGANRTKGAVAASDAFFPFADGAEILINAGVKAIVQPGGSIRDEEVFEAARKAGVTMYVTGTRHFFH